MRALWILITLLLTATVARAQTLHAGIVRTPVAADPQFEMLIWYPTAVDEAIGRVDSLAVAATPDAPVADGRFPIILLSHGGGVAGGNPLSLGELSVQLTRAGFVVVAPFHKQTPLAGRVRQIGLALKAALADARFMPHLDPGRLFLVGFSLGGAVALEAAGARPDVMHFAAYCDAHPEDTMSCDHAPGTGGRGDDKGARRALPPPLPVRAIALLDPFGSLFERKGLAAVVAPVLIVRPEQSELPAAGNALALAAALPRPPRMQTIPGGHFIFTDMCSPARQMNANSVCHADAIVATLARLTAADDVVAFFHAAP